MSDDSSSSGSIQPIPTSGLQSLISVYKRISDTEDDKENQVGEVSTSVASNSEKIKSNVVHPEKTDDMEKPFRLRARTLTSLDELETDDESYVPSTTPVPGEKKKPGRPKKQVSLVDMFKKPKKVGRPRNDSLLDRENISLGPRRPRGRPRKVRDPLISVDEQGSEIIPRNSAEGTPVSISDTRIRTKSELKYVVVEVDEEYVVEQSQRIDSDFDSDEEQILYISEDDSKDWKPSGATGLHGSKRGRPRKYPKIEKDPNEPPKPRGRPRTKPRVERDPNEPVRPRGRPKKERMLDDTAVSVDSTLGSRDSTPKPNVEQRRSARPRKQPVKQEPGIVEFHYDDEVEDDLTNFVFVKTEEPVKKGPGRPKHFELEKQREIIHADVFASPKKQKSGAISLSNTPSPSKKGILSLPGSSPVRTPNGRAGSPKKRKQQLQEFSARKKATRVLYAEMMDEDVADDEDYDDQKELAERIINESRKSVSAAPSPFHTPRHSNINLPVTNPNFVPSPLPSAQEEESFFDSKFQDKALFLDGPEGFFDQHRTKIKSSNNSMVQAPQLEYDEFNSLVLLSGFLHHKEKAKLIKTYKEMYTQWYFELTQGFSLVLYGIGSKRKLLLDFAQEYLSSMINASTIVINGYNPALSFKEILSAIVSTLKLHKLPPRLGDLVDYIVQYYKKRDSSPKLILLIHNIDGPGLRDEKTQTYLSKLASIKQFYVITSVDHINAPLLWDSVNLNNFNFVWHNTTTFADYLTETSFQDILTLGQTQKSAGSKGAKYVLSSLTANSKSLYRVLVSNQLQNMEDDLTAKKAHGGGDAPIKGTAKHALEYKSFYSLCAEEFISSNEINFRTMLMEFVEHKMAVLSKDQSGTEIVFIPFTLEELQKLLEDELL